jgi:hypothetical protein
MRIFNLQPQPIVRKGHKLINKSYNGMLKINLLNEQIKKPVHLKKKPNLTLCKYAYHSKAGFTPHSAHKTNQDTYISYPNIGCLPNVHAFAVVDGHGKFGKDIADLIKYMLPCTRVISSIRK